MKKVFLFAFLAMQVFAQQPPAPATLRSILLQELRETHNQKNWFVSAQEAVAGLTPEQASWTDGKGNHSVGQLVEHLIYWNSRNLADLKGEAKTKYNGNNDETFTKYDAKGWNDAVQRLDAVMTEWEKLVEGASDAKLAEWAPRIANVCEHNAYHIGEMVVVRKEQGAWNPESGVK